MDLDHYWDVAEEDLEIQNPVTDRKLRLLDDYCDIRDGLSVLDIGCGKAWLIRQWAQKFAIEATGLENNPRFVTYAAGRPPARGHIRYVPGPASAFIAPENSFDIVLCLGASEALGGFVGAIDWMVAAAKPGGSVVIGDLTLKHRPISAQDHILPHDVVDTVGIIERHGAEVSATISASEADFERYVSHHRHSTLAWARDHAGHPDHAAALAKSRADWMAYLGWIRPYYGWTIFVGRKAGG
jgi:cyclopropane fatty-acyl-phospholipid synthase-like methyltransferase